MHGPLAQRPHPRWNLVSLPINRSLDLCRLWDGDSGTAPESMVIQCGRIDFRLQTPISAWYGVRGPMVDHLHKWIRWMLRVTTGPLQRLLVYLPLVTNALPDDTPFEDEAWLQPDETLDDLLAQEAVPQALGRLTLGTDYPDTPWLARAWPWWLLRYPLRGRVNLELFLPTGPEDRRLCPCTVSGLSVRRLTVVRYGRAAAQPPARAPLPSRGSSRRPGPWSSWTRSTATWARGRA